jgi:hypothetical protein
MRGQLKSGRAECTWHGPGCLQLGLAACSKTAAYLAATRLAWCWCSAGQQLGSSQACRKEREGD